MFRPGLDDNSAIVAFGYLRKNIPQPFREEWSGGGGNVIHHKFMVCDFNSESPVVFCGSSNLSSGGEQENGDNLIAIRDTRVATLYAVEAIRLFDHYRFRSKQQDRSPSDPLMLDDTAGWSDEYYDDNNIKSLERTVLNPL
jgi:phosphatidylserine/phosphatidylglycerophosphate/cardiolipin synthase-like enzyme